MRGSTRNRQEGAVSLFSKRKSIGFRQRVMSGIALAAVGSLALTACGGGSGGTKADGKNVVYFRYANTQKALGLINMAWQLGYFKGTDLQPKWVGAATSVPAVQLEDQGKVDIATGMFNGDIAGATKGYKFKAIAASMLDLPEDPHMAYFVKKGSPFTKTNLHAIVGKTIAVSGRDSCADLVIEEYLKKNGIQPSQYKIVTMQEPLIPQALAKGQVDLGVFHPPLVGVLLHKSDQFTEAFTSFDDWGQLGGEAPFVASDAWLDKYPKQARELVGILAKTANWANTHPEESKQLAGKIGGYPVEETTNWHYAPNALLDKASLQLWWNLESNVGTPLPGANNLKPEDIATNAYNPYAKTAALLDSQQQNTTILNKEQNTGVLTAGEQ